MIVADSISVLRRRLCGPDGLRNRAEVIVSPMSKGQGAPAEGRHNRPRRFCDLPGDSKA